MVYSEPQTIKQDVEASKHTNYVCVWDLLESSWHP